MTVSIKNTRVVMSDFKIGSDNNEAITLPHSWTWLAQAVRDLFMCYGCSESVSVLVQQLYPVDIFVFCRIFLCAWFEIV